MTLLRTSLAPLRSIAQTARRPLSTSCTKMQNNTLGSTTAMLDVLNKSASSNSQNAPSGTSSSSSVLSFAQRNVLTQPAAVQREKLANDMEVAKTRQDYAQQIPRRWNPGDVYAPHDLTGAEARKWKGKHRSARGDPFDTLAINPIDQYKNFSVMSQYMTEMGRIIHGKNTGLRPINQRRIAKAIRRAIAVGLMPSSHRHPHMIYPDTR